MPGANPTLNGCGCATPFGEGAGGIGRYYDCHPIENMYHEQTILAYELNEQPINVAHGAPLRLRDEV